MHVQPCCYPDEPIAPIELKTTLHENGFSVQVDLLDDDGEMEFRWIVKWDGCVNYETNPDCMGHLCRYEDWERIFRAGRKAYELGITMMGAKADKHARDKLKDWL